MLLSSAAELIAFNECGRQIVQPKIMMPKSLREESSTAELVKILQINLILILFYRIYYFFGKISMSSAA